MSSLISDDLATPKKPWYRLRNVILGSFLLVVVGVGGLALWAVTARGGEPFDAHERLRALRAEHRPGFVEDPAAWDRLVDLAVFVRRTELESEPSVPPIEHDLAVLFDHSRGSDALRDEISARYGEVDVDYVQLLRGPDDPGFDQGAFDRAGLVFDRLMADGFGARVDALASGPLPSAPRFEGPMLLWPFETLITYRSIARVNQVRFYQAVRAGEADAALDAFGVLPALARQASSQGLLIAHVVGLAIEALASSALVELMLDGDLDATMLARIGDAIDAAGPMADAELALRVEWLSTEDIIQRYFTGRRNGNGRLLAGEVGLRGELFTETPTAVGRLANVIGLAMATKRTHLERAGAFYGGHLELLHAPALDLRAVGRHQATSVDSLGFDLMLLEIIMPSADRCVSADVRVRIDAIGARQMLAIELYRARTGRLPDRLEDLVGDTIASLRPDPTTGALLRYRKIDPAEDPLRRAYLLYSVGPDGEDHLGAVPAEPGAVFGRVEAGADYVINTDARVRSRR